MAISIAQLAQQAAAQGQQMLNEDRSNASNYQNQYNNYVGQTNAAQQNVSDYTKAMQGSYDASKGTGNAQSAYDYNLGQQEGNVGYDKNAMTAASSNLNQAQGAMSAYNDFANTAASKWGMNAGGFAAANAGALGSLNNNIASNQGVVSSLLDKYKTAQTGANAVVGLQQKGQEDTLTALNQVFQNATNQRDSAANMMNFYNKLASDQGGLNAQQQSNYAAAEQSYAQASAARAQAGLFGAQAALANQQYQHQAALYNAQQQHMANSAAFAAKPQPAAQPYQPANSVDSLLHNFSFSKLGQFLGGEQMR